eukprot:285126-Prymnesium_polylepis.1
MSQSNEEVAGRELKTAMRHTAANSVAAAKVRATLMELHTGKEIELDRHGGPCNLPGDRVLQLVDGRPRL